MYRLLLPLILLIIFSGSFGQAQAIKSTGDVLKARQKTTKALTPATYKGRQVAVGSGGGFAGFSTTYYLLDNGQLFGRRSQDTAFTLIGKQTSTNTKRVFATVEDKCKVKTTRFDNPGNVYKFVQWRKGKQDYKVAWGAPGTTVPVNYPKFYESFMAMIPASARLN